MEMPESSCSISISIVYLISKKVSTIAFSSHFSRLPTVEYVTKGLSFLSMMSQLFKKVPVEKESSHFMGGTILFLALFAQIYILGQQLPVCYLRCENWNFSKQQIKEEIRLKLCFQKCMCWRQWHNVVETKCTKSTRKSLFSLLFSLLAFKTSPRKLYLVGICSTVKNEQKETKNSIVETTSNY